MNETNQFDNRFCEIRDEEQMLAVKKSVLESLLNFRFRGTTLKYKEILIALENIIIDKVSTKDDSERSKEGDQRIMDVALQAVDRGTGRRQLECWTKGPSWTAQR